MLKYNIKLTDDSIRQEALEWREKYLSPDLSFVTGVTNQDYHLEKYKKLSVTNKLVNNNNSVAELETENVTRQGYVIIKNKTYEVNSGSVVDYSVESGGSVSAYTYLFLNGKYYYADSDDKFHIDHWLTPESLVSGETVEAASETTADNKKIVKLDTIAWIEDGFVNIDGHDYFFDGEIQITSGSTGGLKYYEDGECLEASAITDCKSIEYHPYSSTTEYSGVTKFKLIKQDELSEDFEKISFCKRFYYAKYKEHYLPIRLSGDTFYCDVPNYVLGSENELSGDTYYETSALTLNLINDESGALDPSPLTGKTFDVLLNDAAVVLIEGEQFNIEYDIMNANDGKEIAVYLVGDTANIAIGDRIKFIDSSDTSHTQYVYSVSYSGYNFNNEDTDFILFNGKKYKLEPNLCDKAVISGDGYSIEYLIDYINGKKEGKDCLVLIGDEKVPMKITDDEESGGTLERYGKIISGDSKSAVTATYNIKSYSGITVDNKRYIINEEKSSGETKYYAVLDRSNEYTFIVEDIMGSSMMICTPDINTTDFTNDFNDFISREICYDVVENQRDMVLYTKNKIFGDNEITKELAFQATMNPTSSDDYFNLFDNLDIFIKNGYIHIPLSLSNSQGNNIIQDDIVESQFFDDVKKNAINRIVDMEKDVYSPKYIVGDKYIGSSTEFKPIKQLRVNLHFRTRNLDNWKVEEGYLNVGASGYTDNWFITDYHPYKDILEHPEKLINKDTLEPYEKSASGEVGTVLMNTSDLIGLLNFTNDDVYYQRDKVAKSFLRFSFYDSTNSQTQSLLATSCVFMDEHKLFKTFIDNSRKNISDYGNVEVDILSAGTLNNNTRYVRVDASGDTRNKISVSTEYLGTRQWNEMVYLNENNPYVSFSGTIIDDSHRIGSEFIIDNKYETDTSSEGYYIYIFREYSENLTPKPIYMKVEFNHAGIGHTIPFIIPMHWSGNTTDSGASDYNEMHPASALTLANREDISELMSGCPLSYVYTQTYIPLYAVYDFQNKEYAYVFDNRYVTQDENDVINLNLFELKIMDESHQQTTEAQQREITMKKQERAVINWNTEQFPITDKQCNTQ